VGESAKDIAHDAEAELARVAAQHRGDSMVPGCRRMTPQFLKSGRAIASLGVR
jgi:hypothetical protein